MKSEIDATPCNDCSGVKRFFCFIACKEYNQWNMDKYIAPMFKAPDPVGEDLSKGEVTLTICAGHTFDIRTGICPYCQIDKILKANESLTVATRIARASEQYTREDYAKALMQIKSKDEVNDSLFKTITSQEEEIEGLSKYRHNEARNVTILKSFITNELGVEPGLLPMLLPSGPDDTATINVTDKVAPGEPDGRD